MGVVTTPVRSGAYALRIDYSTTTLTQGRATQINLGLGSTNTMFTRFYLYITAIPTERSAVFRWNSVTTGAGTRGSVSLNTDGSVQIYNGSTSVGSASSPLATNTWYRIETSSVSNGTTQTITLLVDGVTVASGVSFANTNADGTVAQLGWSASGAAGPTKSGTYYIDDFAVNYEAGTSQTSFPGDGKLVMLLPASDSAVGTGWTLGTGTATGGNAHTALANRPPLGVADLTAGSDTKQVRNAASAANSDLDIAVTDYATAGIAAADTISMVGPLFSVGAPSATSPKSGSIQLVSNPAGSLISFGGFYQGANAGTFPTGWVVGGASAANVYGDIASANRGTNPVIRIRQVTSSTRIAMIDFMSVYVDYVAASPTPAPAPIRVIRQAVNRAFSY